MSVLDLSFFTSPVLRGASALSIPTPRESGFALSFIGQGHDSGGALEWVVIPEIDPPSDDAVWAYTPQQVLEGWLRLNPIVVSFALTNAEGKPAVQAGKPNALTLTVTNNARRTVRLVHGAPVAEGAPPSGSIFYVHCGTLVAQADVGKIAFSAPGWTFQSFSSPQYGAYWAAAPAADVVLADGAGVAIAVTGLVPSPPGAQAQVSFDYYAIDGVDDGVFADVLTVQAAQRF
jgi:hypothetical protein